MLSSSSARHVSRRVLLMAPLLATLGLAATTLPFGSAQAQVQQLKIMAPAAPGGGWDSTARTMQAALTKAGIVRNVQVTNIPGAGGTIGLASFVNNMKGDGNQLMATGLVMVGAILANNSPVNLSQVVPIARLIGEYEAIAVPANSDIKTMKDLVDRLKKDPGAVSWGGGSAGGTDHILVGLIAKAVGADPTKINYIAHSGGGEAMATILGGKVTAGVNGYAELAGQIQAGRLRALAISSEQRVPGIDIPTLKEQGVDVELANWRGVVAPPGISDKERKALVEVVDRMAKSEPWREAMKKNDWTDLYMSGDQFASYLKAEDARVTDVLKSIGLVK